MTSNGTVSLRLVLWLVGALLTLLSGVMWAYIDHNAKEFVAVREEINQLRMQTLGIDRLVRAHEERLVEGRLAWPELKQEQIALSRRVQWLEWFVGQDPERSGKSP